MRNGEDTKLPENNDRPMTKAEAKALISERLRDPNLDHENAVRLTGMIIRLNPAWKRQRRARRTKEDTVQSLVRELESKKLPRM